MNSQEPSDTTAADTVTEEIIDPISESKFGGELTIEDICRIARERADLEDDIADKVAALEPAIRTAEEKIADAKSMIKAYEQKLTEFDKTNLPHVRATAMSHREKYNRHDTVTPDYVITTKIFKQPKPIYDPKDVGVTVWAQECCPEALKPREVYKLKLNRYLQEIGSKAAPKHIEFKIPGPTVTLTRISPRRNEEKRRGGQ